MDLTSQICSNIIHKTCAKSANVSVTTAETKVQSITKTVNGKALKIHFVQILKDVY